MLVEQTDDLRNSFYPERKALNYFPPERCRILWGSLGGRDAKSHLMIVGFFGRKGGGGKEIAKQSWHRGDVHPERGGQGEGGSEQPGKQALKISKTVRRGHEQGVLPASRDELGVYSEPQLHPRGVISCLRNRFRGSVLQWLHFSPFSSGQGLQRDTLPGGKG